jgi:hypothetical protein
MASKQTSAHGCSDMDRSVARADFCLPTLEWSRKFRRIAMSHTRIRPTIRSMFAATAALVAACCVCSSVALAGGGSGALPGVHGGSGAAHFPAANRNAGRVDAVERGARPWGFQRVSDGSGLTPVSAEVRGGAHAEQDAQLRSGGSIRADIARYNEERSVAHPGARQADEPRSTANGPYRN